ncbi:MAG: hypothetical protein JWN14_5039 [Chthonomonadales bacterium]|nr:hypothetical protein [Chthonomonadales bacterium]
MNTTLFRKRTALFALALFTITMTGCTSKLDGKYESANGVMSVEFKSDKAYLSTFAGEVQADYEIKDDKVIVKYNGENTVLTRNSDGSLEGPLGKMTKK